MIYVAIAYLAGCLTVPLAAWVVFRIDRWRIAQLDARDE